MIIAIIACLCLLSKNVQNNLLWTFMHGSHALCDVNGTQKVKTHLNKLCNKTFSLPLEDVSLFNLCASFTPMVDEV